MCGIAGICKLGQPGPISLDILKRMAGIMRHRGPDEAGIYLDRGVGLCHVRLSIIDLSSGTQPIHNEDETLWIVYNGEVYNYPELREKLERGGHRFYTTSDTEVILHLYEDMGPKCLSEMNGQFALAIWDTRKQSLFLARDRLGIRPLHYAIQGGSLVFGSEVKAVFASGIVPREIDPAAIDQIFTFWATLPGKTAFRGVHEIPPGHYLTVENGHTVLHEYWSLPSYPPEEMLSDSLDSICEQTQELLRDSIRLRLRSDVPVGTYLSGGLDSSGITALVAKHFNRDVSTFGIRFDDDAFDEGSYQKQMAEFLGTRHTAMAATNEAIGESFPDMIRHVEKPLLRTAPVPLFLLSEKVRDANIKVVLTGEGADELFGGYNIFREAKVRRFWARQPNSQTRGRLIERLYPYLFDDPRLKPGLLAFFSRGLENVNDPLFSHALRWENTSRIKTFFSDALRDSIGDIDLYAQVRGMLPDTFSEHDTLSKAQHLEMMIFLSSYLLSAQGDRVAMAHSLEVRLPYLDHRLVDFAARIPAKWKIMGLQEKHVLKRSFRGVLPDEIVRRDKHPYRAPLRDSLLRGDSSGYARHMLSEKNIQNVGLFDPKKVARLLQKLDRVSTPGEMDGMALVGIFSTQLLHDQFIAHVPVDKDEPLKLDLLVDKR